MLAWTSPKTSDTSHRMNVEIKRDLSVWVPQLVINLALIVGWILHRIPFEMMMVVMVALQVPAVAKRAAKPASPLVIDGKKIQETVTPVIPPAEIDLAKVSSEPPQSTS